MRTLAVSILLLSACDNDEPKHVDASITVVDAPKLVDAAPDAPPDAPNMNVVTACMHACDALAACVMEPADPSCYMDCQADLADCTPQQVRTVDACSTEMCGDIANNDSPLVNCLTAVTCVEMAVAHFPRE